MPTAIDLDSTIRRAPELLAGDIDCEVVLLSLDRGAYYQLNGVGSRIWALAETPIPIAQIVLRLVEEFEVGRAECEACVLEFVRTLCREGLIDVTTGPA
jgi:Coenzyme PQQ synthesis protein D (PqqD)